MTTFIADDFASLGAALREIEAAKSAAKAADVPAESGDVAPATNYHGSTTWAGTYGLSAGSTDYVGFAYKDWSSGPPTDRTTAGHEPLVSWTPSGPHVIGWVSRG